ncbi:MAG: efflux RND transporter periplasmic adaptor subunit, partial [Chloroflexales bacterium]|nr:efflux RND transporter periplasmic adaptor subunit [Chloroflexales bacterium]
MATATMPRQRASSGRWRWIAIGAVVIIIGIVAAVLLSGVGSASGAATLATTTVKSGTLVASVDGSGTIAAARTLDVPFQASGTVTEVLVSEGDVVKAGQVLARVDARDLQAQVDSAQAGLASAQAHLRAAQEGSTTPQDVAAQQASVAQAEANLKKTRQGNSTAADIASAEASVRSAQAQLDALKSPSPDKISTATLSVSQAQNSLQSTRDNASATKTKAELDMQRAVESLTQAQSKYSTAKQQWDYVQETGKDPLNPTTTDSQGNKSDNNVSDAQQQQYYDSYVQAEAAMRSAEQSLAQAQLTYDNARQQEVVDIANAEAKLADTQQQLAALQNPTATDIAQKQAALDQAKASLQKARQGGTAADVAASQAQIDQARANLEKLTAPASASDIEVRQASVAQAEQTLKQAQLNLESAALKAPFDGVITAVNIVPGSVAGSTAALSMLDRSTLHVDLRLSENDVAKASRGQQVALTIDALKGWQGQGTVDYIAPSSETSNGVVTYRVRVSFSDDDARVLVGMSANLSITTAKKDGALLVPNTALLPKGAGQVVQVPDGENGTREVDVQTGLTDGVQTEINSGLKEGDKVVSTPTTTQPRSCGLFG